METNLLVDYIPDDTLDNDTPNMDNGINDNDDYENYINDNNINNDCHHHNDHNDDDNDNNHDNNDGDQTIMIFQAMHLGESFVSEKAKLCESTEILICLHSVNLCLVYKGDLRFLKNHRNRSSRSLCKIEREGNPYRGISTAFL